MSKPKVGRPAEGRKKMTVYVKPITVKKVKKRVSPEHNTLGKVVDFMAEGWP